VASNGKTPNGAAAAAAAAGEDDADGIVGLVVQIVAIVLIFLERTMLALLSLVLRLSERATRSQRKDPLCFCEKRLLNKRHETKTRISNLPLFLFKIQIKHATLC